MHPSNWLTIGMLINVPSATSATGPTVAAAWVPTARQRAPRSGPRASTLRGSLRVLTAGAAAGSATVDMFTNNSWRVFNGRTPVIAMPMIIAQTRPLFSSFCKPS